jgi:hypothetical protein
VTDEVYLATSGTDLYAAGTFTMIGGVSAKNVARWNGIAWSALPSGVNNPVFALAMDGSTPYVAGGSGSSGWVSTLTGSSWAPLGSGMDSAVFALAADASHNVYAGGMFANVVEGVPASRIAKWNGSAWEALGDGVNAPVLALVVDGNDLYAGGDFTTAGGVAARGIARWDGSAWHAVGSGFPGGFVSALAKRGGYLYAGGNFTASGVPGGKYLARWDGLAWSALGSGVDGNVRALGFDSYGNLYVGGDFHSAGSKVSMNFAEWLTTEPTVSASVSPISPTTITLPHGWGSITFPAGAVGSPVTITYTQLLDAPAYTPPTGKTFANRAFTLVAVDGSGNPVTDFSVPYTITLNYWDGDWQTAGVVGEGSLNPMYWSGSAWTPTLPCAECSLDTVANQLVVKLNHLTEFALMGTAYRVYLPLVMRQ